MKRSLLLGVIAFIIVAAPIAASVVTGALYKGAITATNTSYTAQKVAVPFDLGTQGLLDGGYINSDFSNVAIQNSAGEDVPFMPGQAGDPWMMFIPQISQNSAQNYNLYTGGTTAMGGDLVYFPGAGGMTVPDDASLEPGNNFEFEYSGYVDTSVAGDIVSKTGAFTLESDGAGNITASIVNTVTQSYYSTTADGQVYATSGTYSTARNAATGTVDSTGTEIYMGQRLDGGTYYVRRGFLYFDTSGLPDGATITEASINLWSKYDFSTTDFNIVVMNGQPNYPTAVLAASDYAITKYSGDGGSLTTAGISTGAYVTITLNATGLTWINKTGVTKLAIVSSRDISSSAPSGIELWAFSSANTAGTTNDPYISISYNASVNTTASVSSGEHIIKASADTTDLKLYVDGVEEDSVALAGASVPNNANDWVMFADGNVPYMYYTKVTVGGSLVGHWYWEYDTTFTDQSGNGNDAAPTFRTATTDADVSASLKSFTALSQSVFDDTTGSSGPEIVRDSDLPPVFAGFYVDLNADNLPSIGPAINGFLDDRGWPHEFFWLPVVYIGGAAITMVSYRFTRKLLPAAAAGIIWNVFFGAVIGSGFWGLIPIGMIAAGEMINRKKVSV